MAMDQITDIIEELKKNGSSFIFLGGVHGVGKTTVCDRIFTNVGYHCVTASALIKAHGVHSDQNKRVESVADNQEALIEQFDIERQGYTHLLLDGHYCLINKNDEIEPVEVEVFDQISPDVFFLLKDCPKKILARLKKRDGTRWNQSLVEGFQETEERHAQSIADQLGIPLYIISSEEISE